MIDLSKSYIPFSEEQKEQARTTDIVSLLKSQGETVKRSGKEYEWRDGTAKVTIRGSLWFHQYDREGGDAIDFMRRFYNMEYSDAVLYLTGGGMENSASGQNRNRTTRNWCCLNGTIICVEFLLI